MFRRRNKALFVLLRLCGGRISEVLQLKVKDVYDGKQMIDTFTFDRQIMKGKRQRRTLPLHAQCQDLLLPLVQDRDGNKFLFESSEKPGTHITRAAVHKIIKHAVIEAKLADPRLISAHSFRKSFAVDMYKVSNNDLLQTAESLGHANPNTTRSYLKVNRDKVNKAVREQRAI